MKKSHHAACKEEKLANSRENSGRLENTSNPDGQKKLQDKVEKCQQEMNKVQDRIGIPIGLRRCHVTPCHVIKVLRHHHDDGFP